MRYLLDTHAILWYAQGNEMLSRKVRNLIETSNSIYSIVSLWEIALKQQRGKLQCDLTIPELAAFCERSGIGRLAVEPEDIECVKTLPEIHKDPFDRMLVAQAQTRGLTFATRDGTLPQYPVPTIW